ncbi:MAG: DUF1553 domain-containing protein [Pirellulaceae bacterium]
MNHRLGFVSVPATLLTLLLLGSSAVTLRADDAFRVLPPEVELVGNFARAQLLTAAPAASSEARQRAEDLTHAAVYASSDEKVVTVSDTGRLLAVGDGKAVIKVTVNKNTRDVPVTVTGVKERPEIGFASHVRPILNKQGCAGAACHASQFGKGGFKLSVFGYDMRADHTAMARDEVQRRVDLFRPDESLVLKKPTMQTPHGGGLRLRKGSVDYQVLRAWIETGAAAPAKDTVEVERLEVTPAHRVAVVDAQQQLRVEAIYSDGSRRDVTAWARFDSMDDGLLAVDVDGLVRVTGKGQAPIMVRYEGQAEIATFVVPYADSIQLADWENNNFIDELAAAKFRELGIEPSPLCDDATFLRRAFLDATGSLPTAEETLAFLESTEPDKRARLVDQLLGLTGDPKLDLYNDRYAAYWTLKWSDLIRNNSNDLGEQGMWALHNWIKEAFRTNMPFDKFVRELVTAKGSIYMNGPANYFRVNKDTTALTESTAQLFMGVRLECAKCHHHPFERYSQADYYSFASFFSRVGTKNSEEFGLFGREQVVVVRSSGDVRHPRTGELMKPTTLDGDTHDDPLDRRIPMAQWLTSKENTFFARSVVNRYMGYLLGHGLVEPIDDLRLTNPPTNVALMETLAQDFADNDYDLKHLMRTIMTSRLYQLSSELTPDNASDRRFYSHYQVKRLPAEPLLDAVDQVTGVQTKFKNLPPGTRAIELPDAEYPNYFLATFAKPRRASVCECERTPDENLAQALHTLNGDILAGKIADKSGRVAKLMAAEKSHEEIVEALYLATLCRRPSEAEFEASREFLKDSPSPLQCYEDLLWALCNSKHFLFNH